MMSGLQKLDMVTELLFDILGDRLHGLVRLVLTVPRDNNSTSASNNGLP